MDLEGVAAVAGVGVAAVSVIGVLVAARWQVHTALRGADAVYAAALDGVKAQAAASHDQWRRGTQRDAYSAFLLAEAQFREASEQLLVDVSSDRSALDSRIGDVARAKTALRTAFTVVDLEGPEELAILADKIVSNSVPLANVRKSEAEANRAWRQLEEMSDAPWAGGTATVARDRARALLLALTVLEAAVATGSYEGDPREMPGGLPDELRELTNRALSAMHRVRREFSPSDRIALLGKCLAQPLRQPSYERHKGEAAHALEQFVEAARAELAGPSPA